MLISEEREIRERPPFSDHHLCKIRLNRNAVASSSPGDDSSIRAHFVRGHFKIRRTGIFWWSPYVRGDLANGFSDKDYVCA